MPHTDLSETARLLERDGVKTSVQVTDLARDRRVESALIFNFAEVNAIVCIGGNGTNWTLVRRLEEYRQDYDFFIPLAVAMQNGVAAVQTVNTDIWELTASGWTRGWRGR